ncbi:hypothetical protein B0T17DRAFT_223640 [Bombardia bombarda]|uniref:ATP synthase F0 subunit 8 n=1 Tax=Bombardia bombarda TaxID=252184 RepID=A0AA39XAW3_9PEZI|nr:hypothetical protein B0T17DRAFT_223640 [Bombardia bombarda]
MSELAIVVWLVWFSLIWLVYVEEFKFRPPRNRESRVPARPTLVFRPNPVHPFQSIPSYPTAHAVSCSHACIMKKKKVCKSMSSLPSLHNLGWKT